MNDKGVTTFTPDPSGKHRYLILKDDAAKAAFLADKPKFADVAAEFVEYVAGAELIIHNAPFDVEFLDRELELAGLKKLRHYCPEIVDRKSTRLNSSHMSESRMPSSA